MVAKEAGQCKASPAVRACCRQAGRCAVPAASRILNAAIQLQLQHWVTLAVASLALSAALLLPVLLGMRQQRCLLLQQSFNSSAVLEGLQQQRQAAAAATTSAAGTAAREGVPQLHILTIIGSNTPKERIDNSPLLRSLPPALRHSVKVLRAYTRIGHGLEGFGAFGAKIIQLYKYVSNSSIPAADLVLLTDAFDVVMDARAIGSIPKKFARITNCSSSSSSNSSSSDDRGGSCLAVLFAAERACWPDWHKRTCFPQLQHTPYRYLNAGGLVGHVGYLRALLRPFIGKVTKWTDDQRFYTTAYLGLKEQLGFHIDSSCEIFQTLAKVKIPGRDLIFDAGRGSWHNVQTQTYPVLLHGNGNTKHMFFKEIVPELVGSWDWMNETQHGDAQLGTL